MGLETPPHSCQPSTVRAAPLQTALGTSSGRDQRWGRPGALLSREEGQKLRKGGTNAGPVDLELLPLGPRGPPSSGRARAPWRGRRQAGRGPGHPSLGAAGGHGVSAAQVEAGLREGSHRPRAEEEWNWFQRNSVTEKMQEAKENVGSVKAPKGFSVGQN